MKIGFIDSGIGGLTVLQQALISLPEEEYLYYADTDHVPYGTKTREEIVKYVDMAVDFLTEQKVNAIVIACNTATSVAIDSVRSKYRVPILGMEPAVKVAVNKNLGKRVMIMATPLTVREEKLRNLLNQVDEERKVDLLPMPKLVLLAEAGRFETEEVEKYLREELAPYNLSEYSTVVLGCTHFNYFKDSMRNVFPPGVEFIDGIEGTINHLKNILRVDGQVQQETASVQYYKSGRLVTEEEELDFYRELLHRAERMRQY